MATVIISAPIFDVVGSEIIFNAERDGLSGITRRVSRIATLDGGAAINDFGFSEADRTLAINWTPKEKAQAENIDRMVRSYSRLIVSTEGGCFIGAPGLLTTSGLSLQLQILVERRLDQ